jgi:mannose PTS system EIIA component
MSVGLLLITHNRIGEEFLRTACSTLGSCPLPARSLAVTDDADPDRLLERFQQLLDELNGTEGVLVLTDAYGSTPSNIATRLNHLPHIAVVSGLNLPMLLRVMNYPQLALEQLQQKAVSGGRDGVVLAQPEGMR